jgi:uncharacterized protein YycO
VLRQVILAAGLSLAASLAASAQIAPESLPALEAGDLIFKGAETGTGTRLAASWSLEDKRWGHVGIVVTGPDGSLDVIHADTGKPGETGEVREVPLATFLEDVSGIGIYDIRLTGDARDAYLAFAEAAVGLPFDHGFSIRTENSLYCSELVWRAMSAALGQDAIPEKSQRYGRTYVSVSDLAGHPLLHERASISRAEPASHTE